MDSSLDACFVRDSLSPRNLAGLELCVDKFDLELTELFRPLLQ